MARLIVLNIDNNDAAKALIEKLDRIQEDDTMKIFEIGPMLAAVGATVEAVFARPTQFCKCVSTHGKNKGMSGWSKTRRFGWWVHPECRKPSWMAYGVSDTDSRLRVMKDGNNIIDEYRPEENDAIHQERPA